MVPARENTNIPTVAKFILEDLSFIFLNRNHICPDCATAFIRFTANKKYTSINSYVEARDFGDTVDYINIQLNLIRSSVSAMSTEYFDMEEYTFMLSMLKQHSKIIAKEVLSVKRNVATIDALRAKYEAELEVAFIEFYIHKIEYKVDNGVPLSEAARFSRVPSNHFHRIRRIRDIGHKSRGKLVVTLEGIQQIESLYKLEQVLKCPTQ